MYGHTPADGSVESGNEFCLLAGDRLGKLRLNARPSRYSR